MLWDLQAGQGEPITDASSATTVAITLDGRYVIYNSLGGPLGIWDLQTRQGERIFFEHEGHVRAVAITPDGQCVVSASDDQTLKVWELQTGRELATVALENVPQSVAVAPDGTTVLVGDEAGNLYCLRYVDPNAS
jgi:WD40 repeat protein